jgi:anaerobic selenocysteine-containing dehydrogenase
LGEYFWDTEEQCLDFILAPAGITFDEFKNIGFLKGTKEYRTYQTKGFPTPSSKVEIYSERLKEWGFDPLPAYYEPPETPFSTPELTDDYPFVMTSRRCTHYRHSGGRQIPSLRSTHPNPIVSIHPETAQRLGIGEGDWAYIETRRGRMKQKITLAPEIDPRVVVVEYGWWFPEEGPAASYGWDRSNVNILTDDQPPYNREMGSTNLRGILCKIYKAST